MKALWIGLVAVGLWCGNLVAAPSPVVLDVYADAEHEVMMERPAHRDRFHSSASSFFSTRLAMVS